jgi:hypothetical protein
MTAPVRWPGGKVDRSVLSVLQAPYVAARALGCYTEDAS